MKRKEEEEEEEKEEEEQTKKKKKKEKEEEEKKKKCEDRFSLNLTPACPGTHFHTYSLLQNIKIK